MNFSCELSSPDSCFSPREFLEDSIRRRIQDSFKDIVLSSEQISPSNHMYNLPLSEILMPKLDESQSPDTSIDKHSPSSHNINAQGKYSETWDLSDFEESSKSQSQRKRKLDNKKNIPGLIRDRVLTGIKKIVKTSRLDACYDGMRRQYKSLKPKDKERLRYIFEKLDDKGKFDHMKKFLIYLKNCYHTSWKQSKTWKKFKEFLTLPDFQTACGIFREIINEFLYGNGNIDLNLWIENFKGNEEIKQRILSKEFRQDMREFMKSIDSK